MQDASEQGERFITVADFARETNRTIHQVNYIILRGGVRPVRVVGATRLFDRTDLVIAAESPDPLSVTQRGA